MRASTPADHFDAVVPPDVIGKVAIVSVVVSMMSTEVAWYGGQYILPFEASAPTPHFSSVAMGSTTPEMVEVSAVLVLGSMMSTDVDDEGVA